MEMEIKWSNERRGERRREGKRLGIGSVVPFQTGKWVVKIPKHRIRVLKCATRGNRPCAPAHPPRMRGRAGGGVRSPAVRGRGRGILLHGGSPGLAEVRARVIEDGGLPEGHLAVHESHGPSVAAPTATHCSRGCRGGRGEWSQPKGRTCKKKPAIFARNSYSNFFLHHSEI